MTDIVTISYQHGNYEVYDHYRNRTIICNGIDDAIHHAEEIVRHWRWQTRVNDEVAEMTTWEEIRDEIAGMLADGKPLEDVIGKLEKRKNEMAKANLIETIEQMKKPKPMTNEEWLRSISTRELAKNLALLVLYDMPLYDRLHNVFEGGESAVIDECEKWLKEIHE